MTKEYLLKECNKSEFMKFLESDYKGEILSFLDSEGINYLKQYKYPSERISYILCYSRIANEIFKNNEFLDFFFKTNIEDQYASLGGLEESTYDTILYRAHNYLEITKIIQLLNCFNKNYTLNYLLKSLDNYKGSIESLYILYNNIDYSEVKLKILNNYNLDLSRFNSHYFFKEAKSYLSNNKDFNIPNNLITKKLLKSIVDNNDIKKIRSIINNAMYVTDTTYMDEYVSSYEDIIIKEYDGVRTLDKIREQYGYKIPSHDSLRNVDNRILSDYIIDYHFKENYYNVMLDLKELLNLYYEGSIRLSKEKIKIYKKIINIDSLSIKEKKKLHEDLKQYNMLENFYDDMSYARYLVGKAIKDSSLNKEKLEKFKDDTLTKEYGVPVYKMNGETFFGIVKSGSSNYNNNDRYPTGHSYSLIGKGCTTVYTEDTFLYDSSDLNPRQVVHVFPFDSFTLSKPFGKNCVETPTTRVNTLMMPKDIITTSGSYNTYNEILILEQGIEHTEMDLDIKKLKKIALYCIDQITIDDVINAKNENVGIILIPSKNYKKGDGNPRKDIKPLESYDYYKSSFDELAFEEARKNHKI